ncbi:hypothetical protein H6P81_015598 [Aristolochia fimbriata]|uniref:50S ribosomal protein 5, chloroplastic n=1 Tax=Aristolochia fimbriata TaxID=158543 RepID=A0AAV7EAL2_ARIFI|nr:hypothetical protein H6P81_015598 [Aristolochia fimbriata]
MALLFLYPLSSLAPSSSSYPSMAMVANPSSRLQRGKLNLQPSFLDRAWFCTRTVREKGQLVVVRASSEIDGAGAEGSESPPAKPSEESVSFENLPLESKQQMILEQRMKMKLAKKIRLRRKRLVRKRRMRKKGRWPPSKMKKNKNV